MSAPSRALSGREKVFVGGVLAAQIANNALHIAQPLLVMELTGSFGKAALFTAFDTAVHTAGTALGGWPADRFGPRKTLIVSTLLRGAALAAIPAALAAGRLTVGLAAGAYTADAFVRGFFDTAVHALPLELAHEADARDRLNSAYEFAFDAGGVVGPALLGLAFARAAGSLPHAGVAAGFIAAALIFCALPDSRPPAAPAAPATETVPTGPARSGTWDGLRAVLADRELAAAAGGLALFNLFPLRKLLAAFFAKALLHSKAASGPVGAAFGLGGALGALAYAARPKRLPYAGWIAAGALGAAALALGWLPAALAPMAAAAFFFSLTNVCARLAITRRLQERTPLELAGGVTAVARAGSNAVSVLLKAGVGAAFLLGAAPRQAFAILGAGLGALALAQLGLAWREAGSSRRAAVEPAMTELVEVGTRRL